MKSATSYCKFTLGAVCAILISACGGGGDGGSSGISYTGSTTAAAITSTNGEDIATSAYLNGEGGAALGSVMASATVPEIETNGGAPRVTTVIQALSGAIDKIDLTATEQHSLSRATQTYSNTFPGTCGGTAAITTTFDDVTGSFTGNITFSNFCDEGGITMNGVVNISATANLNTLILGPMTMTFSNVTASDSSGSFTIDGNMVMDTNATPLVATVNMKMKDSANSKVFWVENFTVTIGTYTGYTNIGMTGKFYHPDHGYVDVTTPTLLIFAGNDEWPSSGVMIAAGANNSEVKLTVISNTTYNYEVDADGDGVYETQQLNQLWTDL